MRIVYMGTPDIAVPTLRFLAESKHEVVGVLTQPDRPKGRGHHTIPTPVKAVLWNMTFRYTSLCPCEKGKMQRRLWKHCGSWHRI